FSSKNIGYKLAIVSIVKNEGKYLEEWIEYYNSIGVDHIYIYDNESIDNTEEICNKYSDKVSYFKINGKVRQCDAYNDALNRYGNSCEYMAMIDSDEFIFAPPTNENILGKITSHFQSNKKVGGLAINWEMFGSSGYTKKPDGRVTDNFIYRATDNFEKNKHIKTICNPRKVAGFVNPHYAVYMPGYYAVDAEDNVSKGAFTEVVHNKELRINHYFTKSKEEFLAKRARGMADNLDIRKISDFDEHDRNEVFDDSLKKYNNNF
ncbi:glycosyltransferase family 2 protein, partial [Ligilactobacillus agilis]